VKNTLADGALESEEFDDRRLKVGYRHSTSDERAVMNDGCSLISVGAAKELCEDLGIKGVRPVALVVRIGQVHCSTKAINTEPRLHSDLAEPPCLA
jgi:hypothetical protein